MNKRFFARHVFFLSSSQNATLLHFWVIKTNQSPKVWPNRSSCAWVWNCVRVRGRIYNSYESIQLWLRNNWCEQLCNNYNRQIHGQYHIDGVRFCLYFMFWRFVNFPPILLLVVVLFFSLSVFLMHTWNIVTNKTRSSTINSNKDFNHFNLLTKIHSNWWFQSYGPLQ